MGVAIINYFSNSQTTRLIKYKYGKELTFFSNHKINSGSKELYAFDRSKGLVIVWNFESGDIVKKITVKDCGDILTATSINDYFCFYLSESKKEIKRVNLNSKIVESVQIPTLESGPPKLILDSKKWLYFDQISKELRVWDWMEKKYTVKEKIPIVLEDDFKYQLISSSHLVYISTINTKKLESRHFLFNSSTGAFHFLPEAKEFEFAKDPHYIALDGVKLVKLNSDFVDSKGAKKNYESTPDMLLFNSPDRHSFKNFETQNKDFLEKRNDLFLTVFKNNQIVSRKIFEESKHKYFIETLIPNSNLLGLVDLFGKTIFLDRVSLQEQHPENFLFLRTTAAITTLTDSQGKYLFVAAENHIISYDLSQRPIQQYLFDY